MVDPALPGGLKSAMVDFICFMSLTFVQVERANGGSRDSEGRAGSH